MTTVLITGGAGFIGSNVVEMFLKEDYYCVVLDNLSTGKKQNLYSSAKFIHGDITNPSDVNKALKDVEIICHLAAQTSVAVSMKEEILDANINVLGTLELLRQGLSKEIDQFIFSSTGGAIYGEPMVLPVSETHPESPLSIYGVSKLAAEKYIEFYGRQGLKTSILRLANAYGPKQDHHGEAGVISIFLGNIIKNKPIRVFGDGTSSRDYVYVIDVAKVILEEIRNKKTKKPMNVASGKQILLKDLIGIILQVTNGSPKIIYENERQGDVKNIYLDVKLMKQTLGWIPPTDLYSGVKEVWNWLEDPNITSEGNN